MESTQSLITRAEFERAFVADRDRLVSYLFRLTASRQDAEDLAQETYLKASRSLAGFHGRSKLGTWVFAIATNLARDNFRAKMRWKEDTQDRCRTDTEAEPRKVDRMRELAARSPAEKYEFREHIDYCFTCLAKTLRIDAQIILILKEMYRFTVPEIMEIMNLSEGRVKHALADARRIMMDIFNRRCALIRKEGACRQCSEIAGFVNPELEEHRRTLRLELEKEAEAGASDERLLELRLELIRGLDPLHVPGSALHEYLLELMPLSVD